MLTLAVAPGRCLGDGANLALGSPWPGSIARSSAFSGSSAAQLPPRRGIPIIAQRFGRWDPRGGWGRVPEGRLRIDARHALSRPSGIYELCAAASQGSEGSATVMSPSGTGTRPAPGLDEAPRPGTPSPGKDTTNAAPSLLHQFKDFISHPPLIKNLILAKKIPMNGGMVPLDWSFARSTRLLSGKVGDRRQPLSSAPRPSRKNAVVSRSAAGTCALHLKFLKDRHHSARI